MNIDSLLTRRVAEIIDFKHLRELLKSKKKLRVKLGIDPTGFDLHLGHAVPLWKLREFQELGHKAVFIVGDYTAMIGDPSGRDKTRPKLTEKQIENNAKDFFNQAFLILDKAKTEVHLQSEWFRKFGLKDVIHLASLVTEKQILAHDTFRQRIEKDQAFYHHETMYPLLQAYDSVAIKSDVELGAMEQKFNVLMGREVQPHFGQGKQDVMLLHYLIGLDGKEKMSKSLNNYIALTDFPEEMFAKVMSLPDTLILHYFELCTDVSKEDIAEIAMALENKSIHPRDVKVNLALEITQIYHGKTKAQSAHLVFESKFGKNKTKEIKADLTLTKKPGRYQILDLLIQGGLADSKSNARRKIAEGAVEINNQKITDSQETVLVKKNSLIRLGKRFLRII